MRREDIIRLELTHRLEFLTTAQVAKVLGITPDALCKRVTRESIHSPKKMTEGKWTVESVLKLMKK